MLTLTLISSVAVTLLFVLLLFVVWSGEIYLEAGVSRQYEKVLDAILTVVSVFVLCDVWGLF